MIKFPKHKAGLSLEHNEHLNYYATVEDECINNSLYAKEHWISEDQYWKAIETNECWALTWYPDTPVGYCLYRAADLDELLKFVDEG